MRGIIWRASPAKFKTGMCEIKILGSEVLWCVFAILIQGWCTYVVLFVPNCSGKIRNMDIRDENFRIEIYSVFWDVGSGWVGTDAWYYLFRMFR